MKIINKNIEVVNKKAKDDSKILLNFIIRRNIMKSRIVIYSALIGFFLFAFSGCSLLKKAETKSSFAGRQLFTSDSNSSGLQSEEVLYDISDNQSQGRNVSYSGNMDTEDAYDNQQNSSDITSENEEILNENPISIDEDASLDNFENTLSNDGDFVNVTENEVDPDNNVSTETTNIDVDVYTNVIWVPNSSYVSAGWSPYTNGRWVWTRYGWTWKSYYHWGWATYHYGRWWYSHKYGWVWSPGRRWAPGWVVWGHHNNYEGWHPISPRVRHHNGVISPIMPRINSGWVIVKKEDFTKKVNSSTIVTGKTKNDVIKNSTTSITLKKDGNKLYNSGLVTTKNENTLTSKNETSKKNQETTKKKQEVKNESNTPNNVNKKVINSTVSNTIETTKKKPDSKKELNTQVTTKKNTVPEDKNKLNENKKQVSTTKNNTTFTSEQNNSTKENQKKVTEKNNTTQVKKENNTTNVNKNSSNENKTVTKETQKKVTETKQPVYVEKKKVENNFSNSNNTTVTKKTENTNKTVVTEKKVEKSPNVNVSKETNTQQKNVNKK